MKFKQILNEFDKDEQRYEKLKQKLRAGKNISLEDEEWYTDYITGRHRKRHAYQKKYSQELENYLSKNKKYIELKTKLKEIWNKMEDNQPGYSKDNKKWFALKNKYDKIMGEIEKIKRDFYDNYEFN